MATNKNSCMVCKKSLQRNISVPCQVCEEYTHPDCSNISKDLLQYLIDETKSGNNISWSCSTCTKVAKVLNNKIKLLAKEIEDVKKEIKDIKTGQEETNKNIDDIKKDCNKNKEEIDLVDKRVKQSIFAELREREEKRCNVIIHGVPEADNDDLTGMEKKELDIQSVLKITDEILQEEKYDKQDLKFVKRLGEKNDNPRPILLGLRNEDSKCLLLKNAKNLRDSVNYSEINVVPDLTKQQRLEEVELGQEAARRNAEMDPADALNWEWKLVGPKGEKRLVYSRKWEMETGGGRGGGARRARGGNNRGSRARGGPRGRGRRTQ